jgi:microcystin-dependent protein
MSDQFVGELRLVGFNFAPVGWALAQGQLIAISQNTALFSLLGTQYGGDGKTTFALPNMQGNVAIGAGQGPGLSLYNQGETGGSQTVKLLTSEIPQHSHTFLADSLSATTSDGAGAAFAITAATAPIYAPIGGAEQQLNQSFLTNSGASQGHNNMMPYLTLNWIIALQGVFPSRS